MNAEEMFEELGYEKAEKSESVVLYTNGYGDTISFKENKHIVITPIQGCRTIIMTCLLENAIHKQCEELGWFEEEKSETNLERYYDDLIKEDSSDFGVVNGKIESCAYIQCKKCEFEGGDCHKNRITWLISKCKKPKYKFTQFEYDLINTYRHVDDRCKFNGCYQLKSLKEKGYFKNVDKNELIKDIIENCEVV